MSSFSGKRILLVAPSFFGYERDIHAELERLGATVDFVPDRPFVSPLAKAATRLNRRVFLPYMDRFFATRVRAFGAREYDAIFVIQGEGISQATLRRFRAEFPGAHLVLYMWDSMRNKKDLLPNLPLYDAVYTFDRIDSRRLGMVFRPLFYAPGFAQQAARPIAYALSFIGTAHSDRYAIVRRVRRALGHRHAFYTYLFLHAPWFFYAKKIFRASFRDADLAEINFVPLDKQTVQDVFARSLAILDIEHPHQTGLTMRTFETLGAQKKLVTTNQAIRAYDFYDPQNILVIDRDREFVAPDGFFETPFRPLDAALMHKYSLAGWLEEVLGALLPGATPPYALPGGPAGTGPRTAPTAATAAAGSIARMQAYSNAVPSQRGLP